MKALADCKQLPKLDLEDCKGCDGYSHCGPQRKMLPDLSVAH